MKIAVQLTDDDGPLGGDMALLRVIVENDTVLLPKGGQEPEGKKKKGLTNALEGAEKKLAKPDPDENEAAKSIEDELEDMMNPKPKDKGSSTGAKP